MKLKVAFLLAGIVLGITILLQNTQVVTLRLLFWHVSMSQIILVPIILVIGFIIGFLIGKRSWDW